MIFVGLLPFILTILFFTIKSIRFHETYLCNFLYFFNNKLFLHEALDLFWQGMHTPNMFFASLCLDFSTLLIYTAAEVLNRLKELKLWNLFVSLFFLYQQDFWPLSILNHTILF